MLFKEMNRRVPIFLLIQAVCMLLGSYTHISWALRHGLGYPDVNPYSRFFWDSLTFLDPLAVILLFLRPRVGLIFVVIIIGVDILHNAWFIGWGENFRADRERGVSSWRLLLENTNFLLQLVFGAFVFVTLRGNWQGTAGGKGRQVKGK